MSVNEPVAEAQAWHIASGLTLEGTYHESNEG